MGLFELLVYAFMFGAFLLFNYVSQRAARRRRELQRMEQEAAQPQEAYVEEVVFGRPDPLGQSWGRAPEALPPEIPPGFVEEIKVVARRPVAALRQPERPRVGPQISLRTRQDLHHAVIAMTVLGPCRALQPYDADDVASAGSTRQAASSR